MALKFNDVKGEAQKSNIKYFKFTDGVNVFRLVGDILPRYAYFLKLDNGKTVAVECLAFSREEERFTNRVKDVIAEKFPEQKCSWNYLCNALVDGEIKVVPLKKKLFGQILSVASDIGDPTDLDNGYELHVVKSGTGFSTEYTLKQLKCKPKALSDEEKDLVANMKSIDELFPTPTPEEQLAFIEANFSSNSVDDQEAIDDLAEDKPF